MIKTKNTVNELILKINIVKYNVPTYYIVSQNLSFVIISKDQNAGYGIIRENVKKIVFFQSPRKYGKIEEYSNNLFSKKLEVFKK